MRDVNKAFQVLNLKNDSLRKRYDGIKYDVKRVEEIMYDASLHGYLRRDAPTTDPAHEHQLFMSIADASHGHP